MIRQTYRFLSTFAPENKKDTKKDTMKGFLYLLLCYLLGEGLSLLIAGFIPGGVLGMLLLFAGLQSRVIREKDIRAFCRLLIDNMMLFFVPIGVGLMVSYELLLKNLWAIVLILLLSTLIVMGAVGLLQQRFGNKDKNTSHS